MVEKVSKRLGITEAEARALLVTAEEYHNKGKGLALIDGKTTERVADLFRIRPIWLSAELNEKVGWQFSQAIFYLRKDGWPIKTIALGKRMFAYKLDGDIPK